MSHLSHVAPASISARAWKPRARRVAGEEQLPRPWRSRRLPRALPKPGRRLAFRTLLRHATGVPAQLPDGRLGSVEEVVLPALGFDFWADALVVATEDGERLRVPVARVERIDVRTPLIVIR